MLEVEQADREAAAWHYLSLAGPPFTENDVVVGKEYQRGDHDTHGTVQAFAAQRVAERKRCAFIANRIGRDYGEDEVGWSECAETIAAAIFESHRFLFGLSATPPAVVGDLGDHFPTGLRQTLYETATLLEPIGGPITCDCACGVSFSGSDEQEVRYLWAQHATTALRAKLAESDPDCCDNGKCWNNADPTSGQFVACPVHGGGL